MSSNDSWGFYTPAVSDTHIENRSDKGYQGNDSPYDLFFDSSEVLSGNIDDGPAGNQKKQKTAANDND
jgi:hypothetical protein